MNIKFKHFIKFIVIITFFLLSSNLFAQSPESLLKGLEFVEVEIYFTWDENIKKIDHESLEQSIQQICEQELRNNGIKISPEGFCKLAFHFLTSYRDGIVAVSYTMDLYEYIIPRKHLMKLLEDAVTYAQMGMELKQEGGEPVASNLHTLTLENLLRMISSEVNFWWCPTWLSELGVFMIEENYLETAVEDKTRELVKVFIDEFKIANKDE